MNVFQVSKSKIEKHLVAEFLKPFIKQLTKLSDDRQINHMRKFMFHHLLNQSDEGMEYEAKFEAWKEVCYIFKKLRYHGNVEFL